MTRNTFLKEIIPHAQRAAKESGILTSIILAQAIHESNWGDSGLAQRGHNLFGVKGEYKGQSIVMKTWEHINGKDVMVDAKFRKYPTWYESIIDLTTLYMNGVSWDRNKYKAVVGEKDYKKAAKAIQTAGYATDPNYAKRLIETIESNNLTRYDEQEEPYYLKTGTFQSKKAAEEMAAELKKKYGWLIHVMKA